MIKIDLTTLCIIYACIEAIYMIYSFRNLELEEEDISWIRLIIEYIIICVPIINKYLLGDIMIITAVWCVYQIVRLISFIITVTIPEVSIDWLAGLSLYWITGQMVYNSLGNVVELLTKYWDKFSDIWRTIQTANVNLEIICLILYYGIIILAVLREVIYLKKNNK